MPRVAVLCVSFAFLIPASCDGTDAIPGPASSCAAASDCDDGVPCTIDACEKGENGRLFCAWTVAPDQCFADGVCAARGATRAGDPCQWCDPTLAPLAWSPNLAGVACDDGSVCTQNDTCNAGVCGGVPIECADQNACTRDGCDPAVGCTYVPLDGFSCDDGQRCTLDDRCAGDVCGGRADRCDDGDPCTADVCNEVEGCTHVVTDGLACDDGDACTVDDLCRAGACAAGRESTCDDGNVCTIDLCDAQLGCTYLPTQSPCCIGAVSVCDDGDPCSDDMCDPETGACAYATNRAACDDQDPCTTDDVCADGVCTGGAPLACNDANDCTRDACFASYPGLCLHEVFAAECDDGLACSTGDACVEGRCEGDTSECVCVPDLASDGAKLTTVAIGTNGSPAQGVDVDGDPATCAPAGCSGGVDNTLSILAPFANTPLSDAVASGQVLLVVGFSKLPTDPAEVFEVAVYQAALAPSSAGCNVQTQTCDWLVDKSFLDPATCEPIAKIPAMLDGTRLTGGGPGTRLPFEIPFDGASLEVVVANLRLEADVTIQGGQVVSLTGLLGGAVPKATLIEGLETLPEDALPIPKAQAISLVESLVINDIDTDLDGADDAASIGIRIIARDATIVGVTP